MFLLATTVLDTTSTRPETTNGSPQSTIMILLGTSTQETSVTSSLTPETSVTYSMTPETSGTYSMTPDEETSVPSSMTPDTSVSSSLTPAASVTSSMTPETSVTSSITLDLDTLVTSSMTPEIEIPEKTLAFVNLTGESSCEAPSAINNASLINGGHNTSYGYHDVIRFKCDHGYQQLSGDFTLICLGNMSWSGNFPSCSCKFNKISL